MAAELGAENIQVTTVFPGMMRVGSTIQATFTGNNEAEYAWFAAGSVALIISISANASAKRILEGVANGDAEIVFPVVMRAAAIADSLFPELSAWTREVIAAQLPDSDARNHTSGAQSEATLEQLPAGGLVEASMREQQRENNESRK